MLCVLCNVPGLTVAPTVHIRPALVHLCVVEGMWAVLSGGPKHAQRLRVHTPQPTALATAPISPTLPPPVWLCGVCRAVCQRCMGRQAGSTRCDTQGHPAIITSCVAGKEHARDGRKGARTLAREHARTVHQPHALVCHERALESVRRRVYMIYWKAALRRGCCAEEGPCV